ncbi:MAG: hypothetical protein KDA58_02410 [Planctomycetaceae bacterium]|nr:hypothetical protein [Planctomycetaceae bacterium]
MAHARTRTLGLAPRHSAPHRTSRRLPLLLLLAGLLASVLAPALSAQEPDGGQPLVRQASDYYLMDPNADLSGSVIGDPDPVDYGVGGFGVVGRLGHVAGRTVGRTDSLSYMDAMPYMFFEETMLFGDLRLNLANNGKMSGSAGLGLREYFYNVNAVGGLSFHYQRDDTRGVTFEEFTVSQEWLSEWFDVRTNVYMPFGTKRYITNVILEPGSEMFEANNITFQRRTFQSNAMTGFDQMYTIPLPGEMAQSVNAEASAGWYHFQAKDSEFVWGWKLRMDADIFDRLGHAFVEFSNDNTFKSNVIVGADINYWHDLESRPRIGQSQYNRLASWVRKNRTVVSDDTSFLNPREIARKADGTPYLVYHVRHVPGETDRVAPDGTVGNEFNFMQQGIDERPAADIIFVHSDSVFDGDTLPPGVFPNVTFDRADLIVLGEGADLTLPVFGLDTEISIPVVNDPVGDLPLITNVTGNAVTLADNSRFSGFRITNVTDGSAIVGNGVTSGTLEELFIDTVQGTDAHGLSLIDTLGTFRLNGVQISGTGENGMQVIRGSSSIISNTSIANTQNSITNSDGYSLRVEDFAGSINFRQMDILGIPDPDNALDDGGQGVFIGGTAPGLSTGTVTLDTITLVDTNRLRGPAAGIDIFQHSGAVFILNNVSVDTNNGIGIDLHTLDATATFVATNPVSVLNRPSDFEGIRFTDLAETGIGSNIRFTRATFGDDVSVIGTTAGTGGAAAAAILYETPAGQALFQKAITIDGSQAEGIHITNVPVSVATQGQFLANGTTSIDNAIGTSLLIDNVANQTFRAQFSNVQVDNRGDIGIGIFDFDGTARFVSSVNVDNSNNVGASGIDIQRTSNFVLFRDATVRRQVGPGPAINIVDNRSLDLVNDGPSQVTFSIANVDQAIGSNANPVTGILASQNDMISIGAGVVDVIQGRGVIITNNSYINPDTGIRDGGHDVRFTSVSATVADYGIVVLDSLGEFIVEGDAVNSFGSGGAITGMTQAGALFQNRLVAGLEPIGQKVQLDAIDFDNNQRGIIANELIASLTQSTTNDSYLRLDSVQVTDSTREGLLVRDTTDVEVRNSIFDNNGRTGVDNQIEWAATRKFYDVNRNNLGLFDIDEADDVLSYNILIENTSVTDSVGAAIVTLGGAAREPNPHMIYIHSGDTTANRVLPAAPGLVQSFVDPVTGVLIPVLEPQGVGTIDDEVPLRLDVFADTPNQVFASNRQNLSGFHVDWDGRLVQNVIGNRFDLLPGTAGVPSDGQVGFSMDISGEADVLFQANSLRALPLPAMNGPTNVVGFDLLFRSTSVLSIQDFERLDAQDQRIPTFDMQTVDSTAIQLDFRAADNFIDISGNLINFELPTIQSSSTGIVFNFLGDRSVVGISGNEMSLAAVVPNFNTQVTLATGIQIVAGTDEIRLFSDENNIIDLPITKVIGLPFLRELVITPTLQVNGSLLINGSPIP